MINRLASLALFVLCLVMLLVALALLVGCAQKDFNGVGIDIGDCAIYRGTFPPLIGDTVLVVWTDDIPPFNIVQVKTSDGNVFHVNSRYLEIVPPFKREGYERHVVAYGSEVDTIQYMRVVFRIAGPDSDSVHVKMCSPERWKQIMEMRDHR